MTEIEQIFPYTIVSDEKGYGIVDCKGDIVVPCEMDDIVNATDEATGLELWTDYCCVYVVKDGLVGFFTDNGKFIEPAFQNYTVDPCGGDIYVKTEDGFGVFRSPEYVFEEIDEEESMLAGDYEDFEEDNFDDEEENEFSLMGDTDPEEFREEGYRIAESTWNDEYADIEDKSDLQEYVEQVVDTIYDEVSSGQAIIGASEFITPKCIRFADIPLLNKTIKQLCNSSNEDGYYSLFRTIDRLLPHPEDTEDCIISFSEGNRPVFRSEVFGGEIGDIYLYEHGMHMFYVTANIYDSDNPDEMIEECHILNLTDTRLSELLTCLQNEIDPDKTNTELSANIDKASKLEEERDLGYILEECGLSMLKTEATYLNWWESALLHDVTGFMKCVYVSSEGQLNVVIDDGDAYPIDIELLPTNPCFATILEAIKAAANVAWNTHKNNN